MATPSAPGVYVQETDPKIPSLPALPTAVTAAIGIAEKGPIGKATLVTSFDEYVAIFGGYTADSDLALSAQGYFQNGGQEMWVTRIVHLTDINDPASKTSAKASLTLNTAGGAPSAGVSEGTSIAPYNLEPGQFLRINPDVAGAQDAVFDAARASLTASNAETYNIPNGSTLTGFITRTVNGAPEVNPFTITFVDANFDVPTAATASEVALVMNPILSPIGAYVDVDAGAPRINSDQRGTGAIIEVTGGSVNAVLGFSTTPVQGTGDVADIDAVTDAEAKAVIEADITNSSGVTYSNGPGGQPRIASNTTGASSSILIDAASTATAFGFDNALHPGDSGAPAPTLLFEGKYDGAYANNLLIEIAAPTSGGAEDFNVEIQRGNAIVETFEDLSMDPNLPNYVIDAINAASTLVTVTDLGSTASDPRPAIGQFGPMAGGDDGLIGLSDIDVLGSEAGKTGLHTFDSIQIFSLLIAPGFTSGAVHAGMADYIAIYRRDQAFGIIDLPFFLDVQGAIDHVETNNLLGLSSRIAACWPPIKIVNPSRNAIFGPGEQIVVAVSGHLAGVYANSDRIASIWKPPAGITRGIIRGAIGFENEEVLDERKRGLLYRKRINPITTFPGQPIHVDGNRTLRAIANFPTIGEVRGVIFIAQTLEIGLIFLKHEQNTEETRDSANRVVTRLLLDQMRIGAFQSKTPNTAFFVDTSTNINTPSVIDSGQLLIDIGLATAKPVDFVIVRISKDTRALEEEIAAAAA